MNDSSEFNGPFRANELAQYQSGSIVSRIVFKAAGGSVTAFAFDAGQELSEHTVPFNALIQVLDGEAEIRIAENTFHVADGEAIVLPANVTHAVKAVKAFKMLLSMAKE